MSEKHWQKRWIVTKAEIGISAGPADMTVAALDIIKIKKYIGREAGLNSRRNDL